MEKQVSGQSSTSQASSVGKEGCLGCRSFFRDGEQLPLENLRVEFKNFTQIPLKQPKHKYTLLKTINAFLNTKGGSIFIGVEDADCRVKGYYISLKHQDQFKFFVKTLAEKMHPPIDFSNKEEVSTVFLPVMQADKFTGKYIIKIIVKQGQRDAVYTFAQRIRLIGTEKADFEEFQIRNAYRRVGPGGIEKMDPLNLLEEVYRKAKTPHHEQVLHEGCHPRPLEPTYVMKTIGFSGLDRRSLRQKLIKMFNSRLQKDPMECEINYDEDSKVLLVEFEREQDAQKIKNLLHNHLQLLRSEQIELEYVGPETGTYLFRNKHVVSATDSKEQPKHQFKKKQNYKEFKESKEDSQKPTRQPTLQYKPASKKFQTPWFFALTHINVSLRDRLVKFINGLFSKKNYSYEILTNTILIVCPNQVELQHINNVISRNQKELHSYGHGNKIVYGEMTGHLCVYNYMQKQRNELLKYINVILDGKVKACEFKKDINDRSRSYLDLKLDARDAVFALDRLLEDDQIRNYRLRGNSSEAPKMKFMLKCG